MFKKGDKVRGPSIPVDNEPEKIRDWEILAIEDSGQYAIGQNLAAKKPFRHPLDLSKVQKISG